MEGELPSPGTRVGKEIIDIVREMTHLEDAKGALPFSLGVREDSVLLNLLMDTKGAEKSITLAFTGSDIEVMKSK